MSRFSKKLEQERKRHKIIVTICLWALIAISGGFALEAVLTLIQS